MNRKKKKITAGVCVCIAAMLLTGGAVAAEETNILRFKTAGLDTALNVEEQPAEYREKLKISDEAIYSADTVEEAEDDKADLWGYTNLGIAHVDNHLNIREKPGEDGKLVGKMPKNTACEILDEENGWAHIKSGKVEGYVSMDYLYTGEEAEAKGKEVAVTTATVNTTTLKVRGEPSTESIVLTLVPIEEELEVVNLLDGWAEIMLDDEQAFVSLEYVDVEERLGTAVSMKELQYGQGVSNTRVDLVQFAKKFVGNPYVWGGVSLTKGADCSGFVLSVFKQFGISLPHHSVAQAGYGTKINPSEAQPGDLFFYAKNGKINHVAIYIGNGQVVHASSPRTGIKISNAYYRTPATVRRILP